MSERKELIIIRTAAAYLRVSTDSQTEYSPDSQYRAIQHYAQMHDMHIPEQYLFSDEGISGRSSSRPAFQKMIALAGTVPRPFDVILVWKFSRFARNREDSILYKSMLRKQYGIDVISVSEPLSEDKTSVLIEALLEAMDEYYSINLAEEVRRGMAEKARRGGVMGALPYGYQAVQGEIVTDPETAPVIQKIFADFTAGTSVRRIADMLNQSGIRTKYGNLWDSRGIVYILENLFYTGTLHWTPGTEQTIITENSHNALISPDIFSEAQQRLQKLKQNHVRHSHTEHGNLFLLKGLCRCSTCGATLVRNGRSGLQCHQYTTGKCHISHYITCQKLNQMFLNQFLSDMGNLMITAEIKQSNTDVHEIQHHSLEERLRRAKEAYLSGADTLEEYQQNKNIIQHQLTALEQITPPDFPEQNFTFTLSAFMNSELPEELKNEVLRTLIQKIIFDRKQNSITIIYML